MKNQVFLTTLLLPVVSDHSTTVRVKFAVNAFQAYEPSSGALLSLSPFKKKVVYAVGAKAVDQTELGLGYWKVVFNDDVITSVEKDTEGEWVIENGFFRAVKPAAAVKSKPRSSSPSYSFHRKAD